MGLNILIVRSFISTHLSVWNSTKVSRFATYQIQMIRYSIINVVLKVSVNAIDYFINRFTNVSYKWISFIGYALRGPGLDPRHAVSTMTNAELVLVLPQTCFFVKISKNIKMVKIIYIFLISNIVKISLYTY